jgi:hypothetical protein
LTKAQILHFSNSSGTLAHLNNKKVMIWLTKWLKRVLLESILGWTAQAMMMMTMRQLVAAAVDDERAAAACCYRHQTRADARRRPNKWTCWLTNTAAIAVSNMFKILILLWIGATSLVKVKQLVRVLLGRSGGTVKKVGPVSMKHGR